MKKHLVSLGLALLAFALFTLVNLVIFDSFGVRYRLESRNEGEQIFNRLFSSLKEYENFGLAIENTPELKEKILGVGAYAADGRSIYLWGRAPSRFLPGERPDSPDETRARVYIENPSDRTLVFVFRSPRDGPPPPRLDAGNPERKEGRHPSFFFDTLQQADSTYLEIRQEDYWNKRAFLTFLFPTVEFLIAGFLAFVWYLAARNDEYRRRIEEQKHLVVLGTAASTLAHEIKNPLLAIRLQASILERSNPEQNRREVDIIKSEVDRLSSLSHHVNDYLRDPRGSPEVLDPETSALQLSRRFGGSPTVLKLGSDPSLIRIDPERFRSILENLVRNAFESYANGETGEVRVEITKEDGSVLIDVLDKGRGLDEDTLKRAFDPFFTTKSRGSGIGLAICKRFVEAAGGRLSLERRGGGGTRARLIFPEAKS